MPFGAHTVSAGIRINQPLPPPTDTSLYRKALVGNCKSTSILSHAKSRSSQKPRIHYNPELAHELLIQDRGLDKLGKQSDDRQLDPCDLDMQAYFFKNIMPHAPANKAITQFNSLSQRRFFSHPSPPSHQSTHLTLKQSPQHFCH